MSASCSGRNHFLCLQTPGSESCPSEVCGWPCLWWLLEPSLHEHTGPTRLCQGTGPLLSSLTLSSLFFSSLFSSPLLSSLLLFNWGSFFTVASNVKNILRPALFSVRRSTGESGAPLCKRFTWIIVFLSQSWGYLEGKRPDCWNIFLSYYICHSPSVLLHFRTIDNGPSDNLSLLLLWWVLNRLISFLWLVLLSLSFLWWGSVIFLSLLWWLLLYLVCSRCPPLECKGSSCSSSPA